MAGPNMSESAHSGRSKMGKKHELFRTICGLPFPGKYAYSHIRYMTLSADIGRGYSQ